MKIRYLKEEDREGLVECLNSLKETKSNTENFYFALHRRYMDGVHTVVAIENHEIVGTASYFVEGKFLGMDEKTAAYPRCCHIEDVAVREDQQGKGIGKALIEFILEEAKKTKCYKAILMCSDDNIPFYEKCGFHVNQNAMKVFLD